MQKAWIQWAAAGATVLMAMLQGAPLKAQDNTGIRPVAEELDKRTKPVATDDGAPKDKLSDSAVRVMATFAWSIMPDEAPGPGGKMVKVDKSNPQKFFIPIDDARRVIKVATRSAYAEACNLVDLEKANYERLMKGEAGRKVWSPEQLMFINALHMFSVSYFTGNISMTEKNGDAGAQSGDAGAQGAGDDAAAAATGPQYITPKKLDCPPEQKEKVRQAIAAYVQSAEAAPAPSPAPAQAPKAAKPAPLAGRAN
ncbi:MAG: hypothetical protein ACXWJ4_02215 [Methyloceanibacter sp.]